VGTPEKPSKLQLVFASAISHLRCNGSMSEKGLIEKNAV
jgi:hypothetical protein